MSSAEHFRRRAVRFEGTKNEGKRRPPANFSNILTRWRSYTKTKFLAVRELYL